MLIANPIYDSVFKYLMEDLRVAKVILQTIIGQKIEALEITPRERTAQIPSLGLTVFRLDFSAVVVTAEGRRTNVLIELQKADGGNDIRRFRRYLAENYYTESPSRHGAHRVREEEGDSKDSKEPEEVLPIISIYILGYSLPGLQDHSAVSVARTYRDSVTGAEIPARVDFIECLTHDSHVIQLSELNHRRRNNLEKMLALFEQMNLQNNEHLKEFTDEMPGEFNEVLDRLRKAAMDRRILEQMEIEDEVLTAWKQRERVNEKTLAEAKAREEEAKAREEEAKAREEEAKAREEDERRQKEDALAALARVQEELAEQKQRNSGTKQ